MIFLYSLALFILGVAHFLVKRRAASLEQKYMRVALEADALVHLPLRREGNSGRYDPYQAAKRQFQLGALIQKRDRVEAKYNAWNALSERFGKLVARVRGWRGRKLPYTFGAIDVTCVLYALDQLGLAEHVSARVLVQAVMALLNR